MKLTEKKLRVSANINMAYVINYLSKYLGYSCEEAFLRFVSTQCFCELSDLRSGLCSAMSPEVLFIFEEDSSIAIPEDDDKISGAFDISEKLQYIVNMSEAFRIDMKISASKYPQYLKKHNIWKILEHEYDTLHTMKRDEVIKRLRGI